jgi:hypothetical protein
MNSRLRSFAAVLAVAISASAVAAPAAGAAAPASKRVVPVWAGIAHGKPVPNSVVTVRSRKGALLAPAARTDRAGATTLVARRALPSSFVVEVRRTAAPRKGAKRKRAKTRRGKVVLRTTVRRWKGSRVVYVNPYSTIVHHYAKRRPKLSPARAALRVRRHLGIRPGNHRPESTTFRSRHAFDPHRFARAAGRRGGLHAYARRIARDVDGPAKPKRFRAQPRRGTGKRKPRAAASQASTADLGAQRLQTERELEAAAQAALAMATGSPSALLQIGKLLDSLLGGGDTAQLKQIASQLAAIQTGIDDLEQQVSQVDSEVALAAYSSAVAAYSAR